MSTIIITILCFLAKMNKKEWRRGLGGNIPLSFQAWGRRILVIKWVLAMIYWKRSELRSWGLLQRKKRSEMEMLRAERPGLAPLCQLIFQWSKGTNLLSPKSAPCLEFLLSPPSHPSPKLETKESSFSFFPCVHLFHIKLIIRSGLT